MPDRVDPAVKFPQTPALEPVPGGFPAHAPIIQLAPRHHAELAVRYLCDHAIYRYSIFGSYSPHNPRSVGHDRKGCESRRAPSARIET